jgi:hypothetical protein
MNKAIYPPNEIVNSFSVIPATATLNSIVEQFFVPSPQNHSPSVIIPVNINGTLRATISTQELLASNNLYISTNGSTLDVELAFPPLSDVLNLFIDKVQGSVRSWKIGYDGTGRYNIVSPDVNDDHTGVHLKLFVVPQSTPLIYFNLELYPYSTSSPPQAYNFYYLSPTDGEQPPNSGAFVITSTSMTFSFNGIATGVKPNTLAIVDKTPPVVANPVTLTLPTGLNLWTALYGSSALGNVPFTTNTIIITNQSVNNVQFQSAGVIGSNITISGASGSPQTYTLASKASVTVYAKFTSKSTTAATCQIAFVSPVTFTI